METSLVGLLVLVVLLVVIMPALLYFAGWAVTRYIYKAAPRIRVPATLTGLNDTADGEAPARADA
jgi:capsule polysaccharide export protein KpsE/RkpR